MSEEEEYYDEPIDQNEDGEEFYEDELPEPRTFAQKLMPAVACATAVFTILMVSLALLIVGRLIIEKERKNYNVKMAEQPKEEEKEEPPRDILDEEKEIPIEEQVVDPVVIKNVEVADHNETADELDFQEAKGDPSNTSMVNFNMKQTNDAMGIGGGGGGRHGRGRGGRKNLIRGYGGSRRTESAVRKALEWLKKHQATDGSWGGESFQKKCSGGDKCDGVAREGSAYDVGLTGLALLAFSGHGDTHRDGKYRTTVEKGLNWLKKQQRSSGFVGEEDPDSYGTDHPHAAAYNHMLAAYAMADLLTMEDDDTDLRNKTKKAIDKILEPRNTNAAWRYRDYKKSGDTTEPGDGFGINDVSVTAWATMALIGATHADIQVDKQVFNEISTWLDTIADKEGDSVKYGYTKRGQYVSSAVSTSCGLICRQFMNDSKWQKEAANVLLKNLPSWTPGDPEASPNMYYWYYGTLVMFQMQGHWWKQWNDALKTALVKTQRTKTNGGCKDGSWDPIGPWGDWAGRVYSTASGALSLMVYYRYLLVNKKH